MKNEYDYLMDDNGSTLDPSTPDINDPNVHEEDSPNTDEISNEIDKNNDDVVVGAESIKMNISKVQIPPPPPKLLIRRSLIRGRENEYRVYLPANHQFTGEYINRLCRFLDTRTTMDKVTLYLGSNIDSNQTRLMGSVISAISRCNGSVHAVAIGHCGIPETMIFVYCETKEMRQYSALSIGGTRLVVEELPMYRNFYEVFYDKLESDGLLSKEERLDIWKYHREKVILASQYNS